MSLSENQYAKKFDKVIIDDNLYYFLLSYYDRCCKEKIGRKPIGDMNIYELKELMEKAFKYYYDNGAENTNSI